MNLPRRTTPIHPKAYDMFHVFDKDYFVTSAMVAPRKVVEVQAIRKLCNEYGIPAWSSTTTISVRKNASTSSSDSSSSTAKHITGEYRIYLASMDQIAETYYFSKKAQMKLNEMIKNALDPNGILAPGKNGVWPAIYNKAAWILTAESSPTR